MVQSTPRGTDLPLRVPGAEAGEGDFDGASDAGVGIVGGPGAETTGPDDAARLRRELVRALDEDLGGFQLLDQDLALVGDAHLPAHVADLVGLDRDGRLVLVLQLDASGAGSAGASSGAASSGAASSALGAAARADAGLARALDLAALADERRALLERHLGRPLSALPSLVVLAGAELPDELVRRVRVVGPARLRLLEARELRSAGGVTTSYFPSLRAAPPDRPVDVAGFLLKLPGAAAERAAVLVERLRRLGGAVDSRLAVTRAGDGLEWRIGTTLLCTLAWRGEELVGRVGEPGDPRVPREPREVKEPGEPTAADGVAPPLHCLTDAVSVEAFLDAALGRFLALGAVAGG